MNLKYKEDLTAYASDYKNIVELVQSRALMTPKAIAYVYLQDGERDDIKLTYEGIDQLAKRYAITIQQRAPEKDKAILWHGPGLEFIVAFFGTLYAGLTAVPTYMPTRAQKLERLTMVMEDANTNLILSAERHQQEISEILRTEGGVMDSIWINHEETLAADLGEWRESEVSRNSIAFLQYTSGSTSKPKAVMVSHGNILANSEVIREEFRNNASTIGVSWLPHYHDMGLIGNIIQAAYVGFPIILMSPLHFIQKPYRWLQAISRFRSTTSGGPNFAYELCVAKIKEEQKRELDLSSWELAYTGAEMIRSETLERFITAFQNCGFNPKAIYPCYGLAESTLFVTGNRSKGKLLSKKFNMTQIKLNVVQPVMHNESESVELVNCGLAAAGHELRIVDPLTLRRCEPNQVGEVWINGPSIAMGYWRQPDATSEVFQARIRGESELSYLRTGDLGFLHEDNLYITGRKKDLIIIRGQNYYPQDIEATVRETNEALASNGGAVFSIDIEQEEKLVVVQEVDRIHIRKIDYIQTVEQIRHSVLKVHGLKVYSVILVKPLTIPKTTSGKIKRNHCKLQYLNNDYAYLYSWKEK